MPASTASSPNAARRRAIERAAADTIVTVMPKGRKTENGRVLTIPVEAGYGGFLSAYARTPDVSRITADLGSEDAAAAEQARQRGDGRKEMFYGLHVGQQIYR